MSNAGIFFAGRRIVSPAVVSVVDDSAMYNRGLSVGNMLAIVGASDGGTPYEVQRFGSASEARAVLRGGDLLDAVSRAFDPSAETGAPATVLALRVSNAVQSTGTLTDGSGPSIVLTSSDYGLYTTGISVRADAASGGVGRKMTVSLGSDSLTQDNILRQLISLRYTGAQATATVTASATGLTLTAGAPVSVLFSTYKTVADVAYKINATPGWSATVLDGAGDRVATNEFDVTAVAQDAKTSALTLYGNLQALVDWLNAYASAYVTAEKAANAAGLPSTSAGAVFLAGGSDGLAPTVSEWQGAFDSLQGVDVQWVVPLSSNSAIHAMADAHCSYMSGVGKKERRALVGTAMAITDAAAIEAAKMLNSDRTGLVHIGFYDYNAAGAWTLFKPYVLASMIAAGFCGQNPGNAMTNKSLKIRGLERRLRNPTDTDPLLEGGVIPVAETATGFRVVQSISTWLTNAHYNRRELSCGVATDFTARLVREAVEPMIGAKGTPLILAQIASRAESVLAALSVAEPVGPGVLAGDATNPPYKNITATLEGDRVTLTFQCSPVIPVNYITVPIHIVPYSGTAAA